MIRKLPSLTQSVTIGGVLSNHKVVYTYNADGMITGVRHYYYYNDYYYDSEYIVDGTRVLAYQGGDDRGSFYAEYLYDESGSPIGMRYYAYNFETNQRETECVYYFFEKNIFGDIVGVYDEEGDKVLGFTYDAWGNVSITESSEISSLDEGYGTFLKKACIFRYRGYMYESSSGFYYLQTRFYDPAVGRFINADDVGYLGASGDFASYNLFAYCSNNPVMFVDPTGHFIITITLGGALLSAILTAVVDAIIITTAVAAVGLATAMTVDAVQSYKKEKAEEKNEEKEAVSTTEDRKEIYIYRYGSTNPGNLTPSQRDVDLFPITGKGLSFSTIPKPGAAKTTIEAINATGVVYAVPDGPNHVSVFPVGATLEEWHNAGSSSIWTEALKSVVVK